MAGCNGGNSLVNGKNLKRKAGIKMNELKGVYAAIGRVQAELSVCGITKDNTAKAGGGSYKFRGIDDVYNTLSPLLAKHGLCMLPRILSRSCTERKSSSGNALFYVVVEAEFDLVAVDDGSKHTIKTFGEAMDSGDKATNKAMSAAYKYAAFQAFAIPTEGDNDADQTNYTVEPKQRNSPPSIAEFEKKILACSSKEELSNVWNDALSIYGNDSKAMEKLMEARNALKSAKSAQQGGK